MRRLRTVVFITGLFVLSAAASAQEQALEDVTGARAKAREAERSAELTFVLTSRFEYDFAGELKDSNAESSVARLNLNADLTQPLSAQWQLSFNINAEVSWYDWSDAGSVLPGGGDPIGTAYEITLTPGIAYGINRNWSVLGGAIVQFSFEDGADFGDSITYGGYGGVKYTVDEHLSFTIGVVVKTRLEEDIAIFPLLGLRWDINDKVWMTAEGTGGRLNARVAEQWVFSIFGRYERREYRLNEDTAAPIPDGVARDVRVPIGVGLAWEPKPGIRIGIEGGAIVYQEYTFDDSTGGRIAKDRTDAQPFIGISGQITF